VPKSSRANPTPASCRWRSVGGQLVEDELGEAGVAQLAGRHVHADRQRRRDRIGPLREVVAHHRENGGTELGHQAGVLGDLDELSGIDEPVGRGHAQQRLATEHSPIEDAHERLVVHFEATGFEGAPQLLLDGQSPHGTIA
jgi:hypothetical protein